MTEELEIKKVPLYVAKQQDGTTLYSWGTITIKTMTKKQYEELFDSIIKNEDQKPEYWETKS